MFNTDVTKTYEMMDATFEILIMLAGAFLLGALFSWALSKLRGNKTNRKHRYQRKTVDQQNGFRQPLQHAETNYPDDFDTGNIAKKTDTTAIIGGSAAALGSGIANAGSSAVDSISGATRGAGSKLATAGSAVTESLADTGTSIKDGISDTLSSASDKISDAGSLMKENTSNALSSAGDKISDAGAFAKENTTDAITTVSNKIADVGSSIKEDASDTITSTSDKIADASSFIKENTSNAISSTNDTLSNASSTLKDVASDTLDNASDKVSKMKSALSDTVNETTKVTDDFTKIEGIGARIEAALHTAGVKTYADLRASDSETLKAILNAASPAFSMHDPETWPYQADLAYNNKWEKLKEYQDFLLGRED